ncbi:hypothetical protein RQP46_005321 [Phenoliferia psychrophenolica]
MSKIAVSLAALVIVEKHNISLDSNESLAAVLPELKLGSGGPCDTIFDGRDDEDKWKFKPATVGVTLRHLLTHTAGFGYFFASPEDASLREPNGTFPSVLSGAEVAFATPRIFEAGERFLYGSSTDWVARFVERVSGTPLRTALVSLVFEPLGVPAGELDPFRTPQLDQKRGTINAKVAPATFVPIPFDTPQFEQPPPGFAALGSACLWGTLSAWATFLQCLLRKAAPADGGPALISEVLWDEAVSNSLKHYGLKLPAPLLETVDPELCCTVAEYSRPASEVARTASPDGFTMLSTVLHTTKTATGKSPGAHGWAGLSNSFFFIDAEAGVGGVLLAQFFPFGDEASSGGRMSGLDVLDSLSDSQRATLEQFQSVTNTEDLDTAVVVLESAGWDLETAVSKIYDRPTGSSARSPSVDQDDDDDPDSVNRPLMHSFQIDDNDVMPPSGAPRPGGGGVIFWLKQALGILSWPLGIFYGSAGVVLGLIARLLRIRPGLASLRPRNPFTRDPNSRPLSPTASSERWIRALEDLTGSRPPLVASATGAGEPGGSGLRQREGRRVALPDFVVGGYEDALRRAKEELRVLMVVLTCEEHEDDVEFKRNVLTDADLIRALASERVLCWGGDIRDRDAYQVSRTLRPLSYPSISFISLQPSPRAPSSSSPQMSILTRHEGYPTSSTSAHALLTALTTLVLPRSTPFLSRLRAQDASRKAERRIREEQDRAYESAARKDTERVLKRRKEEEDRIRNERREKEEEGEKNAREEERRRVRERAGEWRAWQRGVLENEGEAKEGEGVRVGVRLGDGRRIVRSFRDDDKVERVYAWVECALGEKVDNLATSSSSSSSTTSTKKKAPVAYEHIYEFRLATTFPREVLEVDGSAKDDHIKSKLKGGVNLVVEGLEKRRESMGEAGSDEDDDEEEEDE